MQREDEGISTRCFAGGCSNSQAPTISPYHLTLLDSFIDASTQVDLPIHIPAIMSTTTTTQTNGTTPASSQPITVKPTPEEISSRSLGPRNLELAIRSLHRDGLVVIANAIPHEDLDHLNTKMVQDGRTLQARGKDSPFNYNPGNIQQDPPPSREFFSESIFLNPIAGQVTTAMLGPRPKCM